MRNKIRDILGKHKLIIKYFVTGISASFIDLYLFFALREYYHVWYLYSAIIALSVSFSVAFIIQKYWTFRDFSDHDIHGQFFWYFFTVIFSVFLNLSTLSFLIEFLNFNHMLAQLISLALAGLAGFIMNIRNVFHNMPTKKGIVIAAGIFPPDIGGPATFVYNLGPRLSAQGVDLTVVTYSDSIGDSGHKFDYDVVRISRKIPFGVRHLLYLFWLFLATVNHDLIYAQDVTAAGLPALLVKKLLRKKMIIRIGGDLLWERLAESGKTELSMSRFYESGLHKNSLVFKIGKMVLNNCDKIFVTAENLKELYVKYYGIGEDKIELLHNPLPDLGSMAAPDHSQYKERIVLFAGRLIRYKNLDKLIKIFLEIYEDIKPAKLIIVGEGPESENIRMKIKEGSLGRVELLDKLPHKEVIDRIRDSQLCVSSATTEYNPNFILEALSLGKKVLLNVDNGLTIKLPSDFLFEDEGDFKTKMRRLLLNEIDMSEEQNKIKNMSAENSWERMVDRHLLLFKSFGMK